MSKRILLNCDNKWRDLAGLILLGETLRGAYNLEYDITHRGNFKEDLLSGKYQAAVINSVGELDGLQSRGIPSRLNTRFFILPTEGNPPPNYPFAKRLITGKEESIHLTNVTYFAWNEWTREIVAKNTSWKAYSVGHPRFDIYKQLEIGNSEDYDVVFFTSYPIVNNFIHGFNNKSMMMRHLQVWFADSYQSLDHYYDELLNAFELHIAWIRELSVEFPNMRIFIKVHPFERTSTYEEAFKNVSNVSILPQMYSHEAVFRSELAMSFGSTVLYEFWMLGKPTIFLNSSTESLIKHPTKGHLLANSYNDLRDHIRQHISDKRGLMGQIDTNIRVRLLDEFYNYYRVPSSTRAVAGIIFNEVKDISDPSVKTRPKCHFGRVSKTPKRVIKYLKHLPEKLFMNGEKNRDYASRFVTSKDIRYMKNQLDSCISRLAYPRSSPANLDDHGGK